MLKSVHLVGDGDENEDIYGDFDDDYNPAFDTDDLYGDETVQQALATSYGKRPQSTMNAAGRVPGTAGGARLGTAAMNQRQSTGVKPGGAPVVPGSSMGAGRPMTGIAADPSAARPMTAVRAAGYSSIGGRAGAPGAAALDPLSTATRGPAPPLETKEDDNDEKVKQMEQKVTQLVEESCYARERGEMQLYLERAKEAGRKERLLCRQRDQAQANENVNLDMTYTVLFNLASAYHANQMYQEAANTYNVIVKNKMFSNAGRLRVNIGNVFFDQRKYTQAVKHYRMALDQIPQTHKNIRIKIMKNIAAVFIKLGQYQDAITTLDHIMQDVPDMETGLNLLLSAYALNDKELMKKTFQKLVQVDMAYDEEKYNAGSADDHHHEMILEVIRDDRLRRWEKEKRAFAEKSIMISAKLIAPVIENTFDEGFDWCLEVVKGSSHIELTNELDITRAIEYLKIKDFTKAVETLKKFEKKDSKMESQAAVNLSFLYFLEGDVSVADKHADIAINADRYNPAALVNKACCLMKQNEHNKALEFLTEAQNIESSCTEALYNLGLCYKQMSKFPESLECFLKFQQIVPTNGEVLCQLGEVCEKLGKNDDALEWYHQLLTLIPSDPSVLKKLAELYYGENDKSQAFQFYYEAFRHYPSDINTIKWLGSYYVDAQFVEKAIMYFERAAMAQPLEVKWQLMLATCHRKSGNYQQATETYKHINKKFPENLECLKFLVRIHEDQGLVNEAKEYAELLAKAQKAKEAKEQRVASGGRRGGKKISSAGLQARNSDLSREDVVRDDDSPSSSRVASGKGREEKAKNIDASYVDPMGEAPARPKTAGGRGRPVELDDFEDDDIGDDLLPD